MVAMARVASRQGRPLPKWRHGHLSGHLRLSPCLFLVAITIWRASPSAEQPRAHALSGMDPGAHTFGQGTSRVVPLVVVGRRDAALFAGTLLAAGSGVQSANAEFVTLESGLKYEVVKEGIGDPVVAGEQVQIYFEIYLGGFPEPGTPKKFPDVNTINDGKYPKLIRSSRSPIEEADYTVKPKARQTPMQFEAGFDYQSTSIGGPIRGFTLSVLGMRLGENRNYIFPASLAYKNEFTYIPKNTTLYVEVRLHGKGMPEKGMSELYYGQKPKYKRSFKAPSFLGGGGNGTATDNSSSAPTAVKAPAFES